LNTVNTTVRVSHVLDTLFEEDDDVLTKRRNLFEPEDDEITPK
jgi:hypothetical protein